ncbi:hypothetical protein [Motiliproteus sp. SC1-56]|uniref:hypothetical protein n=1 Tax=Motiliproteus sp. SC1-56 TaxID=2799565 RepID=UPI001A8C2793|nr:hypothetical protein [Motiliproteus sp. SC1-56]
MPNTPIGKMLKDWERHCIEYHPKTTREVAIANEDMIKLEALAEVYRIPQEEIVANLLTHALREVEEKMPYIAGPNVIRMEEGDPVYEDVGPTPNYLKIKARLEREAAQQPPEPSTKQ